MVVIDSLAQGGAEQSLMALLPAALSAGVLPEVTLVRSVAS